jgi:hypothetical protein
MSIPKASDGRLFLTLPYDIGNLGVEAYEMEAGERVQVTEYGGRKLIRRVVADRGESIVVCSEEEYERANGKGRKPDGIGFPKQSIRLLGDGMDG